MSDCHGRLPKMWLCEQSFVPVSWLKVYATDTELTIHLFTLYVLLLQRIISSVSALCWIIQTCEPQYCGVQRSVWRSRPSFKWGPEGAESWTAGHIQRDFPHIMGSNTRCRENRGCLLTDLAPSHSPQGWALIVYDRFQHPSIQLSEAGLKKTTHEYWHRV